MVITSLTRNQVVGQPARGFESHRLRWFFLARESLILGDFRAPSIFYLRHHCGFNKASDEPDFSIRPGMLLLAVRMSIFAVRIVWRYVW